jgi:F1F0 ATPase subunit 2
MNDAVTLALMVAAGAGLGAFFFGGLWWSTRRGLRSTRPALWFASSFLVRMTATLAGFYFLSGARWERLLACLAGFLAARIAATRLSRGGSGEDAHAPES